MNAQKEIIEKANIKCFLLSLKYESFLYNHQDYRQIIISIISYLIMQTNTSNEF